MILNEFEPIRQNSRFLLSTNRLEETHRIFQEIIEGLSGPALNELFNQNYNDIDKLFEFIEREIFEVVYGDGKFMINNLNHTKKLTEEIEEILRVENLLYFTTSVVPEFEINWHHVEWFELIQRYKYLDVLASRDHGKSFAFSNLYPIWKFYRHRPNNNLQRPRKDLLAKKGMLFSFTMTQAKDLLEVLKETIENNDVLREKLMPTSMSEGWGKEGIVCKNGTTLKVRGFGSSIRGAHPHFIIVDDPHKDNIVYSSEQRKKAIRYFHSVVMNAIVPGGQVLVVGTPFHSDDLHGDLKSKMIITPEGKSSGWFVREYPAIFPDGKLLWENRYNYKTLMEKRSTQGNLVFSRELLCKPITNDSTIFPMDIIERAFIRMQNYTLVGNRDSFPIKFKRVVGACDFAISANVAADYSVFITAGIDDEDNIWIINIQRFKGKGFEEQKAILRNIYSNFKHDAIYQEANNFQRIFVTEAAKDGLPVFPHNTDKSKNDFQKGLPALAMLFERGKIKIPRGDKKSIDMADLITLELSSIAFTEKGLQGTIEHDDVAMCLWLLSLAANHMIRGFKYSFI